MGFFASAGSWLVNAGRMILQGLWNGLKSIANGVLDWIRGIGAQIAQGFQDAVGIHSPSTVFAEFGKNIGQGLIVGIGDITPNVVASAVQMSDHLRQGAAASVSAGAAVTAAPTMAANGSAGNAGRSVTFAGNLDSAMATAFMRLIREKQIVIA
jgi:hypothetical protein